MSTRLEQIRRRYPTQQVEPKPQSMVRKAAGRVGNGVVSVIGSAANTAFDGTKWASKKIFIKMLDVTGWVAKGAVLASLTATALTAAGAAISPTVTVNIIDNIAKTLGANPRAAADVFTIGDVVIIQAKYTGELLALALKNGIELGAKSAVYTAQAIYEHIAKPVFQGFSGVLAEEVGKAWNATKQFFTFWK